MAKSLKVRGRLLLGAMCGISLLPLCVGALAAEAEYAIRWTQPQPLDAAARKHLVKLLKMSNLEPTEAFTVRYLAVHRQPAGLQGNGPPILRVRAKHAGASGRPAPGDKVETTVKYRGDVAPEAAPGSCPFGPSRTWKRERDVTWLPPWRPEVLQAMAAERRLSLQPLDGGWPLRVRESLACDGKGDLGTSMPSGWVVATAPCSTRVRRTEAASGLRIEEWGDPSDKRPALVEVSLKVGEDSDAAREKFTRDVAMPLMVLAGVVPEIENKTELSSCR